jgi:polyferredoxin
VLLQNCQSARVVKTATCFLALLLLASFNPQSGYAHDAAPVLPEEEETEQASPHAVEAETETDVTVSPDTTVHEEHDTSRTESAGPDTGGHDMESHGEGGMTMNHPGLPNGWIVLIILVSTAILGWAIGVDSPAKTEPGSKNLANVPLVGRLVDFLSASPIPLFVLKVITVSAFILVVISGLYGTVYPESNLATVLVWNWWWPLVIVSVFFLGSVWCAVCPWDTLSSWLVRRKLWRRAFPHPGFNRQVPKYLRNVWLALLMFIGLTWLELGIGVTSIPMATALMALFMLGLSLLFLILFERKAFCRYACPVGRTLGYYSRLAPIALRPKEQETCASCTTLECYRGSAAVEPCPTKLTIGKFSQNTFCISCGNCVLSCPHKNVSWRLRTMGSEATTDARPSWDGTWFMLILLGITTFHGVTMLPGWTDLVIWIARAIGESGKVVWSFTAGMITGFAVPVIVYAVAIAATMFLVGSRINFKRLFIALPFSTLPLAFTYHLAHNLNHLAREGGGILDLIFNPLGTGIEPATGMARHAQMVSRVPEDFLFAMQAGLMIMGIWLAVNILRYRAANILPGNGSIKGPQLLPMLVFIVLMAGANVWLLSQDMVMRF